MVVKRPKLSLAEQLYLPAIVAGLTITLKHLRKLVSGKTKVTMQRQDLQWLRSITRRYNEQIGVQRNRTPEEEDLCRQAMEGCPVEAIGNNGEG